MSTLILFFAMGGYGFYIWGAYGSLLIFLLAQWYFPWRRWRKYRNAQRSHPL